MALKPARLGPTSVGPLFFRGRTQRKISSYLAEVLADAPIAYYRLGEPSGTTTVDSSGNGHTGSYNNTPVLGTTGLLTDDVDTAVRFSTHGVADGDFVETDTLGNLGSLIGQSTWEFWISTTDNTAADIMGVQNLSGGTFFEVTGNYRILTGSPESGWLEIQYGGEDFHEVGGSTYVPEVFDGQRHHVVIVTGATTFTVYVDGTVRTIEYNTSSTAVASPANFDQNALFPCANFGPPFNYGLNCTLDEVVFYGTPLSDTRVAAHYWAGTKGTTPPVNTSYTISIVDVLSSSDGVARNGVIARSQSDAISNTDVVTRNSSGTRSIADTLTLSDLVTRVTAVIRAITDTETLTSTISQNTTSLRSISDALTLTAATTRSNIGLRTLDDALTNSDVLIRATTASRALPDGFTSAVTIARTSDVSRTITDTDSFSSAVIRGTIAARIGAESLSASEAVVRLTTVLRSSADSSTLSETMLREVVIARLVQDGLSIADVVTRSNAVDRTIVDVCELTDATLSELINNRLISDSTSPTDAIDRITVAARSHASIILLSDLLEDSEDYMRDYEDALTLDDSEEHGFDISLDLADELITTDELDRTTDVLRDLLDDFLTEDQLESAFTVGVNLANELLVTDDLIGGFLYMLDLEDALTGFDDVLDAPTLYDRTPFDTFITQDVIDRSGDFSRSYSTGLTLLDVILRTTIHSRDVTDSWSLLDSLEGHIFTSIFLDDATSFGELLDRTEVVLRSGADGITLPDALFSSLSSSRDITDSTLLSDSSARRQSIFFALSDILISSDLSTHGAINTRSILDSLSSAYVSDRSINNARMSPQSLMLLETLTDTTSTRYVFTNVAGLTVLEGLTRSGIATRALDGAMGVTSDLNATVAPGRVLNDSLGSVIDSVRRTNHTRILPTSFLVTNSQIRNGLTNRFLLDTFTVQDSVLSINGFGGLAEDNLSLSHVISRQTVTQRALADMSNLISIVRLIWIPGPFSRPNTGNLFIGSSIHTVYAQDTRSDTPVAICIEERKMLGHIAEPTVVIEIIDLSETGVMIPELSYEIQQDNVVKTVTLDEAHRLRRDELEAQTVLI